MTTRSGATYKPTMEGERVKLAAGETARTGESSAGSAPLDLVRMLMEDRPWRDEELSGGRAETARARGESARKGVERTDGHDQAAGGDVEHREG